MNRNGLGDGGIKRFMDIISSEISIIVLILLLIIVSIAIKIESSGPVFFSKNRVGKGGEILKIYKLRSMVVNAEELKQKLMKENEASGPMFKIKKDPRITNIGVLLEKHL